MRIAVPALAVILLSSVVSAPGAATPPPPPDDVCDGAIEIPRCAVGSMEGDLTTYNHDYDEWY